MDKILYSLCFNRKGRLKKDGTAQISVCAYKNGKRKYFSTGICIKPAQWDKKKHRIKANAINYMQKNEYLAKCIGDIEKYELNKLLNGEQVSLNELKNEAAESRKHSLVEFMEKEIKENKSISTGTRRVYISCLHRLKQFRKKIYFEDITYSFLIGFEEYLRSMKLNNNSIAKHMKTIRTMINRAYNYGIIQNADHFRNYKFKKEPTSRTYLTPEELEKIENITFSKKNLDYVKDMYLFSVYTGLRFSDVKRVKSSDIQDIEGKKYLVITMKKTKEPLRLPISQLFNGKSIDIIKKHSSEKNGVIFNKYDNEEANRILKSVADHAGISGKNLTFHTARHTTATYLIYKGVPLAVVQKILGHTSISTTQIYAKVMDMTTENELKKILWK